MKKSIMFGFFSFLAIAFLAVTAFTGCGTTSGGSVSPGRLTSPEAVLSGTAIVSGSTVTVKLNSILISGEAIEGLTGSKFKVYAGTGADATKYDEVSATVSVPTTSKIDMVFILDATGSMWQEIAAAKNSIVAFANSLEAEGSDVKFGLVAYSDVSNEAELALPATAAQMEAKLATITASGGDDFPENPLDAIMYAYEEFTWRSDAQKVFIVITDASAHQLGDYSSEHTCERLLTSVEAALSGNAVVYAVSAKFDSNSSIWISSYPGTTDIRLLSDGYGWFSGVDATTYGITKPNSGTGGKWIELPADGNVDLSALGIATTVTKGYDIAFTYTVSGSVLYIHVMVDTDGDGVFDSDGLITLTISTAGTSKWLPNGQLADPALGVKGSSNN